MEATNTMIVLVLTWWLVNLKGGQSWSSTSVSSVVWFVPSKTNSRKSKQNIMCNSRKKKLPEHLFQISNCYKQKYNMLLPVFTECLLLGTCPLPPPPPSSGVSKVRVCPILNFEFLDRIWDSPQFVISLISRVLVKCSMMILYFCSNFQFSPASWCLCF